MIKKTYKYKQGIKKSELIILNTLVLAIGTLATSAFAGETSEKHGPNCPAVMVIKKGDEYLMRKVSGYSEEGKPLNEKMAMGIGSNTKTFTAVLVMKLVDQGILNLEQPIQEVLPKDVVNYLQSIDKQDRLKYVKIKHLLNQSSSIRDKLTPEVVNKMLNLLYNYDSTKTITVNDRLALLETYFQPDTVPGDFSAYANSNAILSGAVIEHVTGKPYHVMLREHVLKPAGMKHTYLAGKEKPIGEIGYSWEDDGKSAKNIKRELYDQLPWSSGALFSTVDDVILFRQALFSGKLISKKSLNYMLTSLVQGSPGYVDPATTVNRWDYLSGLFRMKINGQTGYNHTGGTFFYASYIVSFPDKNIHAYAIDNYRESCDVGAAMDNELKKFVK